MCCPFRDDFCTLNVNISDVGDWNIMRSKNEPMDKPNEENLHLVG